MHAFVMMLHTLTDAYIYTQLYTGKKVDFPFNTNCVCASNHLDMVLILLVASNLMPRTETLLCASD